MDFIKPTTITDALFVSSTLPETDHAEWASGDTYSIGNQVIVTTPDIHEVYESLTDNNTDNYPPSDTTNWLKVSATNRWKVFDKTLGSQTEGTIVADLLDEDCSNITDWTDGDNPTSAAVSEVDPAGQFRFDTNSSDSGDPARFRYIASAPNKFTIEIKTYFDALDTRAQGPFLLLFYGSSTWRFKAQFASDGLVITKSGYTQTAIGTNIVKCNANAAWQTWRFQVDKSSGEANATVEVFLNDIPQGTFDCDDIQTGLTAGYIELSLEGNNVDNLVAHVDYIKIATGLGKIDTSISAFNYVLKPGTADSIALLNLDTTSVEITEIDNDDNLVVNGEGWTDATGTTPPTGWTAVNAPADFTIDTGALKITTDGANEGISQTITVSAATEYQLLGLYKNTSGDIAQYAVYDVTHSADILATTDLASSTVESNFSYVFTTPAGCTSIKISLLGKASGDIIWFDSVKLAPTKYSETITTGTAKTDIVKTDLVQKANGIITITFNKTSGAPKVGELIVGVKTYIGKMRHSPSFSYKNYSTITTDIYGHDTIVVRAKAKTLKCAVIVENTAIDEINRLMMLYADTALVWVASELYSCLIVYGYCTNWQGVIPYLTTTDCSLDIRGLT
jgi:hypothetical protein